MFISYYGMATEHRPISALTETYGINNLVWNIYNAVVGLCVIEHAWR